MHTVSLPKPTKKITESFAGCTCRLVKSEKSFNKDVYLKCFLACSKEKEKTLHARSAHWLQGLTKCQCQRGFCAVSHLRYSREKNSQLWLLSTSDRLCSQAKV